MTQAYTPGLKVAERIVHQARRLLPIPGEVLVKQGQQVTAREIVAATSMPGDVTPINVSQLLGVPPAEVPGLMLCAEGSRISAGNPLARSRGIFGFLKTECASRVAGTVESVSKLTGQVIIRGEPLPVQVRAYLSGLVQEVLPQHGVVMQSEVTFVQGIFGVGGEAYGPLQMACARPDQPLTHELLTPKMAGAVVVGGARVTSETLLRAVQLKVSALVTGGIDDQDLRDFLGYDLGVAITGSEQLGLTLIITEGFGDIAMADRTYQLLRQRAGAEAAVNGATQIRAGVMRPEILIPWPASSRPASSNGVTALASGALEVGVPVRIIRDPWFGMIGEVSSLPPEPVVLESGSKARVLVVKLRDGSQVSVPRANVERIEEGSQ